MMYNEGAAESMLQSVGVVLTLTFLINALNYK